MYQAVKRFLTATWLIFFLSCAVFAQSPETGFDVEKFRELATRAEGVVSSEQASTEALGKLRSDLASYRSEALKVQESRAKRVETVNKQIAVLGPIPEGRLSETEEVAARRAELNGQLAEARAPLIVAQEAFRRSSGLISEIDKIIRNRKTTALLQLDNTPINPVRWPVAIAALTKHIQEITTEVKTQWTSSVPAQVRKQNGPVIFLLIAFGLILMIPATRWVSRNLESYGDEASNNLSNVMRLVSSFAVFALPMLGLFLIAKSIGLAEIVLVRGNFLMHSTPFVGLSLFGANWLAHNLSQSKAYTNDPTDARTGLIAGGQYSIMLIGVVLAFYYLLDGLADGAEWSTDILSVLRFPLVVMLGVGLFRIGQKIGKYRALLQADENVSGVTERVATLFMWASHISGLGGIVLAALGYSNAGAMLVFSMVLSLALSAALFFIFILLIRFIGQPAAAVTTITEERPKGGLYKVLLAFVLMCASIPIFALIWGARISDITNLWFTLNEGVSLGDTRISISDFLVFILIFFIGYTITRLLQSALRTAVLPNTSIESGAQNALTTGFGYIGIFLAALIAIMATGLDLSNLAIVAGALSVGIGFGLQAIVSNFVSGIILLIERPVKIGDWVEVGAYSGNISKISVRSTSIDTFDGATVILPNADLIAGTVTNWTHGNVRGRVKVPVGVAYGTDPEKVQEILLSIAEDHPITLKLPKPWVVFMGFGADSMNFELRAILRDVNYVLSAASDMNFEIVKRFEAEGIEIPFAQRVVTIKNPQDLMPQPAKPTRKARTKPKT